MTKLEALEELVAKVEAGEIQEGLNTSSVFEKPHDMLAVDAFHGSLDAALKLHEAVLPQARQYSIVTDLICVNVHVCAWPDGLAAEREIQGEGWSESNPARAWLHAILKALIAMEEEG